MSLNYWLYGEANRPARAARTGTDCKAALWGRGKGSWERLGYQVEARGNPGGNMRQCYLTSERLQHHPVPPARGQHPSLSPFGQRRPQELQENTDTAVPVTSTKLYRDPNRDYFLNSTFALASHWLVHSIYAHFSFPITWSLCYECSKGAQQRDKSMSKENTR